MSHSNTLTHVILGDGAAGMSAADVIRSKRPADRIIIVAADPHPYYYRAALTNYLMGELSDEEIWALPPDGWQKLRLQRHNGSAVGLDAARQTVHLQDGKTLTYDRLLIATGARARRLASPAEDPNHGIPGADRPGISVIRTLVDTRRIIDAVPRTKRAVVLGGGILGIEACQGLVARNVNVTLIHRSPILMERLLDQRASELVERRMLRDGVDVRLNSVVREIRGRSKRISGVVLQDGSRLPCSMLIVCIGIVPNTEWLSDSGINLDRGFIPVDRHMCVPGAYNIWAAGDVATFRDDSLPYSNPSGLWQPARKQGHIAGMGMVASSKLSAPEYRPGVIYNSSRAWDLDFSSLGDHVGQEGTPLIFESRLAGKPIYKKILIRDNHVVGGLLLGDRREGHALRHLMNLKGPAGDISSISRRILDPEFDLPAWVASRALQPGVQRWKQTVMIPTGAVPPSVVAAKRAATQLQIALPTSADATLLNSQIDYPVTLRVGTERKTFQSQRVRIGADSECELVVANRFNSNERLVLSREGLLWVAFSTRRRHPQATWNGKPLDSPQIVANNDVLTLGRWHAVVEISARNDGTTDQRDDDACLIGTETMRLSAAVTSIGSSPDNDIVVTGQGISSFHAQIHRTGQPSDYYIVDFGGLGTYVNKKRVYSPVILTTGDVVNIAAVSLRFQRNMVAPSAQGEFSSNQVAGPSGVGTSRREKGRRHSAAAGPGRPGAASRKQETSPTAHERIYLTLLEGPASGRVLTIPVPGTLGRGSQADVRLNDPLLSRVHARFEVHGDQILVSDVGSLNGIALDGVRLPVGHATRITPRSQLRLGRNVCRISGQAPDADKTPVAPAASVDPPRRDRRPSDDVHADRKSIPRATLDPLTKTPGIGTVTLAGPGPFTLGREAGCPGEFRLPVVSKQHAEISIGDEETTWLIRDLGSQLGTRLNGVVVNQTGVPLNDGDVIALGPLALRFAKQSTEPPESKPVAAPDEPRQAPRGGFRIDWASVGDPLAKDLRKTVQEELDSCIGCHDCMRACPLPDSRIVSIGGLNAYAAGIGKPSRTVLNFVDDCTQCQACVPVCPADIQRSRIVLWNKLKKVPSPDRRLSIQVGDTYLTSKTTLGELTTHFEKHPVLGVLNGPERMALFGSARFRRLLAGEQLLEEGMYPDALWIVVDGHLETGMSTGDGRFQRMVILSRGQTVGETAVLSDQPSEVSAYATENTTVAGLPKYSLRAHGQQNRRFREALDSLYVSRSMEAFVKKLPALEGVSDEALLGLLAEFDAERYVPGKEIFSAAEELSTFAMIRRGFVREIRRVDGREVVSNYLKAGDAFGARPSDRRGELLRFEAATLAEVFTVQTDKLRQLDRRWPGLAARLAPMQAQAAGPRVGQTQMFQQAAVEGLLQASRLMVIDTRSCVDCNNCVTACTRRHGASRLDRSNSGLQAGPYQIPASCFHCDDPVCLLCAVDGIVREPSGEIRIVEDNCIGCAACAERCPYDNIQMVARDYRSLPLVERLMPRSLFDFLGFQRAEASLADAERVAVKCDLCAGFNNGPACVRSCPTGAAQRVDPMKLFSDHD